MRAMVLVVLSPGDAVLCRSPRYGQHLNVDDIARIVQAPDSEISAVTSWLHRNSIEHRVSKTQHVVEAQAPVAAIEALLRCELYLFQNKEQPQRTMVRKIGSMFLPTEVAEVVQFVFNVAGECGSVCCPAQLDLPLCVIFSTNARVQIPRCRARAVCTASRSPLSPECGRRQTPLRT